VVRLALSASSEDVRLFVARLVRKYRSSDPELAKQMDLSLRTKAPRASHPLRKLTPPPFEAATHPALPVDDESQLALFRTFADFPHDAPPLLAGDVQHTLAQLISERRQPERLHAIGLSPTRSAIFVGPPGVGKTLTARWLAAQLGVPLFVLNLAAVMSSLLGRSGSNVRAALDFAKATPCVVLLDEIDAIAKKRSDEMDVGELKRLVTVILQEVDEWPSSGLLLAATNHRTLIDPALWRRFDLVVDFKMPDESATKDAVARFLGPSKAQFGPWIDVLAHTFEGASFSDIEHDLQRLRRAVALGANPEEALVVEVVKPRALAMPQPARIELSVLLAERTHLSQRTVWEITGVSRDTIRRRVGASQLAKKKRKRRASA